MKALLFLLACAGVLAINPDGVKSIGTAIKGGHLTTDEQTVFEYSGSPGYITEQWHTGGAASTRVRVYIDGETTPSLDYNAYRANGIGFSDEAAPHGNLLMGKNAKDNCYNTYRIPFGKSIKISLAMESGDSTFWYIVRGLAAANPLPIKIGDIDLPVNARLHMYPQYNITLQVKQYTTLYQSKVPTAGMLWMVFIEGMSKDENFLEACFRAYIDGATSPLYLSSGTEDFFLSAFYYNVGPFDSMNSGLTHKDVGNLSMYKTFIRDPLLFSKNMTLVWRNMEDSACPSHWNPSSESRGDTLDDVLRSASEESVGVAPLTYTSYIWVYEW